MPSNSSSSLGFKLLENPAALCNIVRRIAIEAGEITMEYFDLPDDDHIEQKADGSPVTLADREAEAFIQGALADLMPDVPMIGEEAAELGSSPDLSGHECFWLVDPLDGTKEFIRGGEEFTVNIALVRRGVPVLGVVYAPFPGVLYAAHGPDTAVRWNEDSGKEKSIRVRSMPREGITVVSSRLHGDGGRMSQFLEGFKVNKVLRKASSLKICAIAEGKADLYPRFGPTCEWDTAAGDAILRAAGGMITDLDGQVLSYGVGRPKFLNPEFIASSFEWFGGEE